MVVDVVRHEGEMRGMVQMKKVERRVMRQQSAHIADRDRGVTVWSEGDEVVKGKAICKGMSVAIDVEDFGAVEEEGNAI